MIISLEVSLLLIISAVYLLTTGIVIFWRGFREHAIHLLVIFLVTSAIWELLHAVWQLVNVSLPPEAIFWEVPIQGVLLLAFLCFMLSRAFLRLSKAERDWWAIGIAVMALVLLARVLIFFLFPETIQVAGQPIQQQHIGRGITILGWAGFMSGVALLTLRVYHQAQGALHRNRLKYWHLVLLFLVFGDGLLFFERDVVGSTLRLAATLLMTYAVSTYRLLNVNQMIRHLLSYLIITLLTTIFFLVSFFGIQQIIQMGVGYDTLVPPIVALSVLLAMLFNPLLNFVRYIVDRLVLGRGYDPNELVREYSVSISNILSLHRLAVISLELIRQTFNTQHGTLFLVHEKDKTQPDKIHWQAVKSLGNKRLQSGYLSKNSPVVAYLHDRRRPLIQYDLDMLPQFRKLANAEREWLSGLGVEVFVPIHAKNEWIGLFALGPKNSRNPYFDNDLVLLSTLADQAAVALENARLVENLLQLNKDLKATSRQLDAANRQLTELDHLKSAFIGVVTHELRSPFINIDFSLQLIERHGLDHLTADQQEQFQQLNKQVKSAKQMIDNLVNFASFLSKRGELHLTQVDLLPIIKEAVMPNNPLINKNHLKLHIEIPADFPGVTGDQERLKDAIYQLINNAVKFTPVNGDIWVRCRQLPQTIRLEVQDNGIGVPADKLPHLWEGFAQMSDPLLRGLEGLGLGLTLVKYVANAHGGEVFAESQVGVGSTFGFQIPL